MIPPGTTRIYIEWDEGAGKCRCDDGGDAYYYISDGVNEQFHIHGTGQCGSCANQFPNYILRNTWEPTNDTTDIGWRHNSTSPSGGVTLMISGDNRTVDYHIMDQSEESWWMAGVEDSRFLSTLTIPGTHDSGTYNFSGGEVTDLWVRTQDLDFTGQLMTGSRFFDMRCESVNNECELYHSTYDLGITLEDAIANQIEPFLQQYPTETVLMTIKEEDPPASGSLPLEQVIYNDIQSHPGWWYTGTTIPTLGQVRGKIVLLRRYSTSNNTYALGIDVSNWPDNATFTETNSAGVTYSVQDQYDNVDYGTKEGYILNEFNAAKVGSPNTLYINFTSSYHLADLWPKVYAVWHINPWLFSGLQYNMGDANIPERTRLGIVVLNYPDQADNWVLGSNTINPTDIPLLLIGYNDFAMMQANQPDGLVPGQYLLSRSGDYELLYQSDGNLVNYYHPGQPDQTPVWASGTPGQSPGFASVTSDGVLVLDDPSGHQYWSRGGGGNPNSTLTLGNAIGVDGSLTLQNQIGQILWRCDPNAWSC